MDDRRFDVLVRSLATGSSRRQVLRGMLGLGGGAVAASSVLEAGAARRKTPTPAPILTCPGRQIFKNGVCTCPDDAPFKCGGDCCTHGTSGPVGPGESVCCDGACCFGECYGEEYCCPDGREYCGATGECCPEGSTCCNDPYFGVGCISGTQCCGNPDCEVPPPCHSTTCYPGNECAARFDCTVDPEACCSDGQVCVDGGECCNSSCEFLPPCSLNECFEQCPCPNSGDICAGETCAPTCPTPGLPCGNCDECGCLNQNGGYGPATCLDTSTDAGSCNDYRDCPTGTVCSEVASDQPGYSFLCLYPCCAVS